MQSKPKSNSVVTHERPADRPQVIVFKVKDAIAVGTPGLIEFDTALVSEAVKARACLHGLVQRVSDAAAMSRDTATGKPATPEVKLAAMRRLADHYMTGSDDWSPARAETTGAGLDRVILAAVCEALGKDDAAVRAMVAEGATRKSLTPRAYLEALGTAKVVAPILERLRLANVSPEFDPDAELDEATKEG